MKDYIKLVRLPNLVFLAAIQFLMYKCVVLPILQIHGFDIAGRNLEISLLIISTVLIAAGGYVLNDYFDVKIDAINKDGKQIVGNTVTRKTAMTLHNVLTALGVILGLVLTYMAGSLSLGFIFIIVPGLLWFYSASYKRQFLTGNIIIAFISALSILTVAIMELAFLQKTYGNFIFMTSIPSLVYRWIGGFAGFAFLYTWIREVIKDLEDQKGDREMECRTMAIKWGTQKTKIFLYTLIGITIIALFLVNNFISFHGSLTLRYILFGLVIPLLALAYLIFIAKDSKDYHQASTFAKIIMGIGVLYCFIFYFLLAQQFDIPLFNLFMVK